MKVFFKWLSFIIVVGGLIWLASKIPAISLTWWQVLGMGLSFAFVWVEILKFGSVRPFNCISCLTGWFSLIFGLWSFGWAGVVFLPIGVFVGSVFSLIQMRYL